MVPGFADVPFFFFTMYTIFGCVLPKHPQDLLEKLPYGFSAGAAALRPNIL